MSITARPFAASFPKFTGSSAGCRAFAIAALLLGRVIAPAAEPELRPEDLPHFPALEPAAALKSFEIVPGYSLELAAHEPQVLDPIALTFDEKGRLYVVEMRDYSERRPERLGRIRRLEDRDADGVYETATVYLDQIPWPTAVTCWDGGVFVGTTPDVLYARDEDGDGRADIRETVFTGFASDYAPYATNKLNVQALLNSFHWGVDARIHGASGMTGGKVSLVDSAFTRAWRARAGLTGDAAAAAPPVLDVRGRDFSFDPRTLRMRLETGGGQHGMSFDNTGRKFLCSNSDHLQVALFEDCYTGGSPWFSMPSPRASIAADGSAAPVFRISPEEPWRVIRTRWRVTGLVEGLIEGGGRSSGYFTSATGLTVYRGDAYGPDSVGDAFVADCGSNLIHRKKIRQTGCDLIGERPASEKDREFIASRDTWFRPVQFANAPDGCLWFADMYREVIEHPWSLPPNLKRLIDLNSGNDRGRLYRVVPVGAKLRRQVDLTALSPRQWVETLSHANGWHRDAASRLLVQRRDPETIAALQEAVRNAPNPLGKVHALHVLSAIGAPDAALLASALRDSSAVVQQHALRRAEEQFEGAEIPAGSELARAIASLTQAAPDVRLQLALSLRNLRLPDRDALLAQLLRSAQGRVGENLIQDAVLASAGTQILPLFRATLASSTAASSTPILATLAGVLGRRNDAAEVTAVLETLASQPASAASLRIASQFAAGLTTAGSSLAKLNAAQRLGTLQSMARELLTRRNPAPDADTARDAVRVLADLDAAGSRATLLGLLHPDRDAALQRAAVETLFRLEPRRAWIEILSQWPQTQPEARVLALDLLLRQSFGPASALDALANTRVRAADLSASQISALRSHADAATRERAVQLLGAPSATRADALATALPALNLRGDAQRGAAVYAGQCATCHRLGGQGFALGPDLESIRSQPKEKLLVALVDPNREVQPVYLTTTVETKDGEAITGLPGNDEADAVSLRQAGGVTARVPRDRIQSSKQDGRSLMPEGFESTLTPQQMADLLALLTGTP